MTAATLRTVPTEEDEQLLRETSAWGEYRAAVLRNDKDEATRLWQVYSEIHAQRPASMVERLERQKGLF